MTLSRLLPALLVSCAAIAALAPRALADVEINLSGTIAASCDIVESPADTVLQTTQPVGALVGIGTLRVECNMDGPWRIRFGSRNGNLLVNESVPTATVAYSTAWAGFGGTGCCGTQPPGGPGTYGPWFDFSGSVVTGTYAVRLDQAFPNVAGTYSDTQYIEVSP